MGTSCLLTARVSGYRRVPEPPARMMPFISSRRRYHAPARPPPTGIRGRAKWGGAPGGAPSTSHEIPSRIDTAPDVALTHGRRRLLLLIAERLNGRRTTDDAALARAEGPTVAVDGRADIGVGLGAGRVHGGCRERPDS